MAVRAQRFQAYRKPFAHALFVVAITLSVASCSTPGIIGPEDVIEIETGESQTDESTTAQTDQGSTTKSIWDGVYTQEQSERGKASYLQQCAECHREDLRGDEQMSPSLVGVGFTFRWRNLSLHDIFLSVQATMPQNAPRSLGDQVYVDLIAFLLDANAFPTGDEELTADETVLRAILIKGKPR